MNPIETEDRTVQVTEEPIAPGHLAASSDGVAVASTSTSVGRPIARGAGQHRALFLDRPARSLVQERVHAAGGVARDVLPCRGFLGRDSAAVAWGFAATCLLASSNYVINEILDARTDRSHRVEGRAPIPSGLVRLPIAYAEWLLLGAAGLAASFALSPSFASGRRHAVADGRAL